MEINREKTSNLLIFFLIVILLFTVYLRFFKKNRETIRFPEIEDIILFTVDEKEMKFSDLLQNEECYILFFELSNCSPCIFKGLNELRELKRRGREVYAITIHSWIEEWKTWVNNVEFNDIYLLT